MAKWYWYKHEKVLFINGVCYEDYYSWGINNPSSDYRVREILIDFSASKTIITWNKVKEGSFYISEWAADAWNNGQSQQIMYKINGQGYYNNRGEISKSSLSYNKGNLIETIKAEEGSYPLNGLYSDGYWYIKGDKATIPINTNINGDWKESETAYVNVNGVWKEIKGIHQAQNGEWNKLF